MTCVHLKQLYQLCQGKGLKLSSSDLIHIVCEQCGVQEACPSMLMDQYDQQENKKKSEPQPARPSDSRST